MSQNNPHEDKARLVSFNNNDDINNNVNNSHLSPSERANSNNIHQDDPHHHLHGDHKRTSSWSHWIQDEYRHFRHASKLSIAEVKHGIKRASWRSIALVVIGIIMSIVGAGGQIISVNQWLFHFPFDARNNRPVGGPYIVLLSGGLSSLVLYICVYIGWQIKFKPGFGFLKLKEMYIYGSGLGLLLACNGFLAIYSTPHTPEVVQALLIASQIVWTLIFAVIFKINQGKNYCHVLVISALVLSVAGIVLGTLATSAPATHESAADRAIWAFLFGLGVVPGSLVNVVVAKFFQTCCYEEGDDTDENDIAEGQAAPLIKNASRQCLCPDNEEEEEENETEDVETPADSPTTIRKKRIVRFGKNPKELEEAEKQKAQEAKDKLLSGIPQELKIEMGHANILILVWMSLFQLVGCLIGMPLDWAPFFGPNAGSSANSIAELSSGFACVFNSLDLEMPIANISNVNQTIWVADNTCAQNAGYFAAFCICFALTNAGNVIVNMYSAPLTSMVAQVASPITAILLDAVPALSPTPTKSNIGLAVVGVILLVVGAALFSFWEEMTSERKYELKDLIKEGILKISQSGMTLDDGVNYSSRSDLPGGAANGNNNDGSNYGTPASPPQRKEQQQQQPSAQAAVAIISNVTNASDVTVDYPAGSSLEVDPDTLTPMGGKKSQF